MDADGPGDLAALVSIGAVEDDEGRRDIFQARIEGWSDWVSLAQDSTWTSVVERNEDGFALFVAGDAAGVAADVIAAFAEHCIANGCFSVSTWGTDCERVHDMFDEVDIDTAEDNDAPIVMTTWHNDETLDDAMTLLW